MGSHAKDLSQCKACTDFKSWAKAQSAKQDGKADSAPEGGKECPLDKDGLGNVTWSFLHTMAAYYPEKPTQQEQADMKSFMNLFSKFYPCRICAEDLQKDLKELPPETQSASSFSTWLCQIHNRVNVKLGKPVFDCSKVFERWKDGWKDGSCD